MANAKLLATLIVVCWTCSLRAQPLSTAREADDISLSTGDVDVGSNGRRTVRQAWNYGFDVDTWLHSWRVADPIRNRDKQQRLPSLETKRTRRQIADRRLQRAPATSAPLQGLSLLDLPVFSRGDRPSSMDKTLGAIFSKVAFSAATNQTTGVKNEVFDSAKTDAERNATASIKPTESAPPSSPGASTVTEATSTTSQSSSSAATSTTTTTGRPKPVFELDTRVFDFIPYERTAPPANTNQRQYNPNVPGLRGPSRINTARNPLDLGPNQPFNLRPTIPPLLIDLTSSTVSRTTTTSTTTSTSTTTTHVPPAATTIQEEGDQVDQDETPVPTTTPVVVTKTSPSSPITATSPSTTIAPGVPSASGDVGEDLSDSGESKRQTTDKHRETAWSFQVYGASTLFTLLGIFALSNLLRLRTSTRRLLNTSHCLSIQLLVLFLAITRSIHLLYDPYNHKRLLPAALAFCIFNVGFPCLSSALAVLLLGMFKATKLQILPGVIVKPALWAALVAFHFALSLSIDIVVGSVGGLFSLHLASQAYFVLWSLALSLGYFAAFAPAVRAAKSLQAETMRATLTALHIHGASLPRRLPRPSLLRAVRVTLAAAIFALLVAAFQLYGMFGVYGLPWRQQPASNQGLSTLNSVVSAPVVLTPEFLARYQGMQRDRNINVDALRQVLGLTNNNEARTHDQKRDPWPVAPENFWPWWTYQFIARLLEFVMGALIAYVGSQPLRHNEVLTEKNVENASKKSSLWLFSAGKSLKSGSMETLSTLCCQTNKGTRTREMGAVMGATMTASDLSPVKSMGSDEMNYSGPNARNYCYSNPTQVSMTQMDRPSMPLPRDHLSQAGTLPAFPIVYGSKRSQRRCASTLSHNQISSVLVNDNGFIRFREGAQHQEETYEDVDRTRSPSDNHHSQHIYQELGHKPQSVTYYSTSTSSITSSSVNTHKCSGTATTPSTCTYEHLCRRGLAGYYEPQRYEMQLPNAQLLSLLAKESCQVFPPNNIYGSQRSQPPSCQHCHCKETSSCLKSPNYESYGPKPEAQAPATPVQVSMHSDVRQATSCSLVENYIQTLLAAQAQRNPQVMEAGHPDSSLLDLQLSLTPLHPSQQHLYPLACQQRDKDAMNGQDEALHCRHEDSNDLYLSQCASTCSSESAGNSFDVRLYPHHTPQHLHHLIHHHAHHSTLPQIQSAIVNPHDSAGSKTTSCFMRRIGERAELYHHNHPSCINQSPLPTGLDDSNPDSAIVADVSDIPDADANEKTSAATSTSPLSSIFRLGSISFRRSQTPANNRVDSQSHSPAGRTSLHEKLFNRFRSNNCDSRSSNSHGISSSLSAHTGAPLQMYGYSPLVGSDENVYCHPNCISPGQSACDTDTNRSPLKDMAMASNARGSARLLEQPTVGTAVEMDRPTKANQQSHDWLSSDLVHQHGEKSSGFGLVSSPADLSHPSSNSEESVSATFELCDTISCLEDPSRKCESTSSITSSSAASTSASEKKMLIPSPFSSCHIKDCQDRPDFSSSSAAEAESSV